MPPIYPRPVTLCLALLFLTSSLSRALDISIPLHAASTTPKITPSHVSLSIEMDRWTDWAGSVSRNQFFFNTLDNLKQITGTPPSVRVGGNTMDATTFRADIGFAQDVFPTPTSTTPYPEAKNVTIGNLFYGTAQFLPPNTHVTMGVNLGSNNITTAFLEARSIMAAFSSPAIRNAGIVLDFLEIGNEPDLYKNNGRRAITYSYTQYVKEWITFATNVSAAASLSSTSTTKFLGASFAGSSHSTTGFSPQAIFSAGILSSAPGKLISTISQHRYSGSFCSGSAALLQDLMTKANIRSNLTEFVPDITATKAKGLNYILGETNSYSCHGAPGVSDTAGAALWALDYSLFASQIGIFSVHFHAGIGYKYNMLQPITLTRSIRDGSTLPQSLPPHIQPEYYAAIIAGEAIGNKGDTQIQELPVNHTQITGYAFYESGVLARAVFINLKAYSGTAARTNVQLNLTFTGTGSSAPSSMSIKRLAIKQAPDTSGVTWGGQTYETSDARVSGSLSTQVVKAAQGFNIQETEAVLVQFS
ncbi:glycoside hydrolase family 79 protein [Tricholoma matsutake]|nr:glycoside hydrolase family 79 protein [Tricholoma matsutake 945]